jgi:uncharacterized membrane protein
MDQDTPIVIAGGKYASREDADVAFKRVWDARHDGEFDHMSCAVLSKNADGSLRMDRHDSTTKHLLWGGVALGAVLSVIAPPVGIGMIASAGAVGGVGAIVGHFWHNIPKKELRELSDLIADGQGALVIVAVNQKGTDIKPLLSDAQNVKVVETRAGDIDTEFAKALKEDQAAAAAK